MAAPGNSDAAMSLEKAIDQGADALPVAEAFLKASEAVDAGEVEHKKSLLFRAGRIFDAAAQDKAQAEAAYLGRSSSSTHPTTSRRWR